MKAWVGASALALVFALGLLVGGTLTPSCAAAVAAPAAPRLCVCDPVPPTSQGAAHTSCGSAEKAGAPRREPVVSYLLHALGCTSANMVGELWLRFTLRRTCTHTLCAAAPTDSNCHASSRTASCRGTPAAGGPS